MVDNIQGRGAGRAGGGQEMRGLGRGFGRPGGPKNCVCPNCGYKIAHMRGQRCIEQKCPKCGTPLIGEWKR